MTTIEIEDTVRERIKEIERLRKKPVVPLGEDGLPIPVPVLPPRPVEPLPIVADANAKEHPDHEVLKLADDGCPHVDDEPDAEGS